MARLLDKFLDEHAIIAETVARFVATGRETLEGLFVIEGHAQPLAATARTGFDHDRVADALGNFNREEIYETHGIFGTKIDDSTFTLRQQDLDDQNNTDIQIDTKSATGVVHLKRNGNYNLTTEILDCLRD